MHGLVNIIIGKNLFRRSLHGSSKNVHQYCDGSSDPGCEVDIKIAGNVNFIHPKFVISFDLSPCVWWSKHAKHGGPMAIYYDHFYGDPKLMDVFNHLPSGYD